ncbi:lysophospholipid acyltransferase family protein [Azospirillum picis]|uniref:1-acyl-sn-glycerol-3-phosphate acyltransferase n=1 Tax=Azospirillum picis TaxID=488438 RepID=A0ABU0MMY7_9PROT|nr:lysophospholipid acyltransferase family protein [Azospirillum picis]MBP2301207.1 1-acyl-sn-glycerol-3-phosphate acyltransferase [Azospirillum picis]MDQ0534830.1 1-acyl-sn-glycerol-3-phosphate acyltransferase [Azospirillum picis]
MNGDPLGLRSSALFRFFGAVMAHRLRRGFHAVRLARPGWPALAPGRPAIVYLNHPSWWDPAVLILMADSRYRERPGYGPIDAAMLRRYPFMARIGLFGIEPGRAGAAAFLRHGERILADPRAMLWVTAEGTFTDPRCRPVRLRPGVAHLVRRVPSAQVVPMALEYPFWNESTPEVLARFGEPLDAAELAGRPVAEIASVLESRLEAAMDLLAADARSRDPARFTTLVAGRAGVGGVYDLWRRARAWAGGRNFSPAHEDLHEDGGAGEARR